MENGRWLWRIRRRRVGYLNVLQKNSVGRFLSFRRHLVTKEMRMSFMTAVLYDDRYDGLR